LAFVNMERSKNF